MLLIPNELNKNIKHAYINSNSSPPFCQSSTKGLKTKQIKTYSSPLFVQNKESIKEDVLPLLV